MLGCHGSYFSSFFQPTIFQVVFPPPPLKKNVHLLEGEGVTFQRDGRYSEGRFWNKGFSFSNVNFELTLREGEWGTEMPGLFKVVEARVVLRDLHCKRLLLKKGIWISNVH
jgi:hypothetical protein